MYIDTTLFYKTFHLIVVYFQQTASIANFKWQHGGQSVFFITFLLFLICKMFGYPAKKTLIRLIVNNIYILMMHVIIYITLLMFRISTRGMRRLSLDGLRVRSKHRKLKRSNTKANLSIIIF